MSCRMRLHRARSVRCSVPLTRSGSRALPLEIQFTCQGPLSVVIKEKASGHTSSRYMYTSLGGYTSLGDLAGALL